MADFADEVANHTKSVSVAKKTHVRMTMELVRFDPRAFHMIMNSQKVAQRWTRLKEGEFHVRGAAQQC